MHYVDEGHGEPILAVHGNPTWSFYWRNIIAKFSQTQRAIAADQRFRYAQRNETENGCRRRHENRPQAILARLHDGLMSR